MRENDDHPAESKGLPTGLADDIAALAAVMKEHGLAKIQVNANGVRLSLSAPQAYPPKGSAAPAMVAASEPTDEPESAPNGAVSGYIVPSPMIGTYYSAPRPGEEPFVRVGDLVAAGQTVAIIEAMKIMNEIQAERGGIVEEFLVSNGQPVEYNQGLMRLTQ
jgi:acetyl-CoA carboxylase biotin carboxyl carrier protein